MHAWRMKTARNHHHHHRRITRAYNCSMFVYTKYNNIHTYSSSYYLQDFASTSTIFYCFKRREIKTSFLRFHLSILIHSFLIIIQCKFDFTCDLHKKQQQLQTATEENNNHLDRRRRRR